MPFVAVTRSKRERVPFVVGTERKVSGMGKMKPKRVFDL